MLSGLDDSYLNFMEMRLKEKVLYVLLSAVVLNSVSARTIPNEKVLIRSEIVDSDHHITNTGVGEEPTHEEQECLHFFSQNMPVSDHTVLRYEFLYRQIKLALKARSDNAWAKGVPFDVFLNDVMAYANLDEPREDWRSTFYDLFSPLVVGTDSILEAAEALNSAIWTLGNWNITFKSEQTPNIMSPSQVIAHGYASCTGLAIFLVDACRAVGIPARVAGIAEWPETGGNHNWVEVWHKGVWSFTDPLGFPGRPWNSTWFFPDPVRRARLHSFENGVYASSFKQTGRVFPLAWNDEYESSVPAVEVTQYYINAAQEAATAAAVGDEHTAEGSEAAAAGGVPPWELHGDVAQQ